MRVKTEEERRQFFGAFERTTWRGVILKQYSLVCQVPGAEQYTICPYTGTDLSQVIGIAQANMPGGHYGWIQECGDGFVSVSGQTQAAYADFRPNAAKRELSEQSKGLEKQVAELTSAELREFPHDRLERLSQLPPLLMEDGLCCRLIREARDVFVDGHFYACVAMSGISFERFQRDKAAPFGATREHKMWQIRATLEYRRVLSPGTLDLCKRMADLRNDYAHGHGLNPEQDALKSLAWIHSFIENETSLMRGYVIVDGMLSRKRPPGGG